MLCSVCVCTITPKSNFPVHIQTDLPPVFFKTGCNSKWPLPEAKKRIISVHSSFRFSNPNFRFKTVWLFSALMMDPEPVSLMPMNEFRNRFFRRLDFVHKRRSILAGALIIQRHSRPTLLLSKDIFFWKKAIRQRSVEVTAKQGKENLRPMEVLQTISITERPALSPGKARCEWISYLR